MSCIVKIIIPHQHGPDRSHHWDTQTYLFMVSTPPSLVTHSGSPCELWLAGLTQVQMCSEEIYTRLQPCIHPHQPRVKGEVVKRFDKFYSFVAVLLCHSMRALATEKKIYWRAGTKAKTNKHQSSQQRQKQKHNMAIWPPEMTNRPSLSQILCKVALLEGITRDQFVFLYLAKKSWTR